MTDELHYLGTDADDNDHYVDTVRDVVWVENTEGVIGGIQRVPTLGQYVVHVRDVCGWDEVNYSDKSLGEELAEIVEAATKQMEAGA